MTRWDESRFAAELRLRAAERLARAATALVAAHQKNLSVANPSPHRSPAARGQFPRGRTFFLRANIGFVPTTLAEIAAAGQVVVGIHDPAFYGAVLSQRGWLGLTDTYARSKRDILRSLRG